MGLALCYCRQTRSTEVGISPGPTRCKDGGRGVLMMGVDIRGGVMLWINMRREVSTEGCLTVAGSMLCRSQCKKFIKIAFRSDSVDSVSTRPKFEVGPNRRS